MHITQPIRVKTHGVIILDDRGGHLALRVVDAFLVVKVEFKVIVDGYGGGRWGVLGRFNSVLACPSRRG